MPPAPGSRRPSHVVHPRADRVTPRRRTALSRGDSFDFDRGCR
jgi:hypothetical protein